MRQETRPEGAKTPRASTAKKHKTASKGVKRSAKKANGEKAGAKQLEQIYERRRANLQELRERRYNNSIKEMGDAVGKAKTFMWQLLSGHRTISETMARDLEEKLGIQPLALDQLRAFEAPTTSLKVHIGEGHSAEYRMVPRKRLGNLEEPLEEFHLCPVQCGENTFYVIIESATLPDVALGEQVFIDPDDTVTQHLKLYLVTHTDFTLNSAALMKAERADTGKWWLRDTHGKLIESKGYLVIGRAICAARGL